MKKLKVNLIMVLALFIGAVAMSFKLTSNEDPKFYYDSESTSPGAFADMENWKQGDSPLSCNTGVNKPCEIIAEDDEELEEKLDGLNNSQVLAIAHTKRN